MSYNFPLSPATGTLYAPPEGPTWRFLDGAWQQETEIDPPLIGAAYYDSVAQAAASTISGSLNAIQVLGYYAAGDGGGALYKRVGVAPTHAGKIHSADGAWWEIAETILPVGAFGAVGTGTNEGPAFQAALDTGMALNRPVACDGGKTYVFDPPTHTPTGNGVRVNIGHGQSSMLLGNGATLKFKDGLPATAAKYWHLVLFCMGSAYGTPANSIAEKVVVRDLTLDGNFRGLASAPAAPSDVEQRAALKVIVDPVTSANNCFLRYVEIVGVHQKDPIADHIQIGPSTVVSSAPIGYVNIDKCHAGARNSVRAFIQLGSSVGETNISGITCDLPTGVETNSIETEFASIGTQVGTVRMSNVVIDDIEVGSKAWANAHQLKMVLSNVKARNFALFVWCELEAVNCVFPITFTNSWQVLRAKIVDCEFLHGVFDSSGTSELRKLLFSTNTAVNIHYSEHNCRHRIVGTVTPPPGGTPPAAANYFIDTGNVAATDFGKHVWEFHGCWFDPLAPGSIDAMAGGIIKTHGCTFGGFVYAVKTGSSGSFSGAWESYDDDFSKITAVGALPFRVEANVAVATSFSFVELHGGRFPTGNYGRIGSFEPEHLRFSSRRFAVAAVPTGGGVTGDTAYFTHAAYAAAASAAPVAWLCVATHSTAATWRQTATKP